MKKRIWGELSVSSPIRAVLLAGALLALFVACTMDPSQSGFELDDVLSISVQPLVKAKGISTESFAVTSLDIDVTRVSTGTVVQSISWVPADGTATYDVPVPGPGDYDIDVEHNGVNEAGDTVAAAEGVTVSLQPMVITVVSVVPGQIGLITVLGALPVSRVFPTSAATTCSISGACTTLGAGGGGRYFQTGDHLEETLSGTGLSSISGLDLSFDMDDHTTTYCTVGLLEWNVSVNGTVVGTYQYTGGSSLGRISFSESYTFAPVVGVGSGGDDYTIRLEATTTVCPGASSWNWFPNGTATLNP
jgi:hypothetical protein